MGLSVPSATGSLLSARRCFVLWVALPHAEYRIQNSAQDTGRDATPLSRNGNAARCVKAEAARRDARHSLTARGSTYEQERAPVANTWKLFLAYKTLPELWKGMPTPPASRGLR